jgi:hypothetical protein
LFAACKLVHLEPKFQQLNGEIASPLMYVLSQKLHRRHLTPSQRAGIAAEMIPLLEEEARKRQGGATKFHGSAPIGAEPGETNKVNDIASYGTENGGRSRMLAAKAYKSGRPPWTVQ